MTGAQDRGVERRHAAVPEVRRRLAEAPERRRVARAVEVASWRRWARHRAGSALGVVDHRAELGARRALGVAGLARLAVLNSDGSRNILRPFATSWSFGDLSTSASSTALRIFVCTGPWRSFTLPWFMSTVAGAVGPPPASEHDREPRDDDRRDSGREPNRLPLHEPPSPSLAARAASARPRTDPPGARRAGCGRPGSRCGTARRPRRSRPRRCGSPTPAAREPRRAAARRGRAGTRRARRREPRGVEGVAELVAEVVGDDARRVVRRDEQRDRARGVVRLAADAGDRAGDAQRVAELARASA